MLLSITGYDAAVLDSYVKFVQNAAQMTDINLTKRYTFSHHFLSFSLDKTIITCSYSVYSYRFISQGAVGAVMPCSPTLHTLAVSVQMIYFAHGKLFFRYDLVSRQILSSHIPTILWVS